MKVNTGIPVLELLDIKINNKDNLLDNNNTESNIQIWTLDLINKKVGCNQTSIWIHHDLVIQLAHTIICSSSKSFGLEVYLLKSKVKSQY